MGPAAVLLLVLSAPLAIATAASKYGELETVHQWERLDFAWASGKAREDAIATSRYLPDYCVPFDVKAVDGEVFVTVPRLRHGVPSTVNHVLVRKDGKAVLSPYPSWELNTPGDDCQGIQNAFVIEIDPLRRMWILDSGSRDTYSKPNNVCSPKLLVWDMVYGEEVRRVEFPQELVTRNSAMLRGLVLDTTDKNPEDWFAYITDTKDYQLLVYSWREDAVWNVTHKTMEYDPEAFSIQIGDDIVAFPTGIDSIALSQRGATEPRLFFAAQSSFNFYSIPTSFLRNRTLVSLASSAALDAEITLVGTRSSQSEGMTISDAGIMFYSVLDANAINQWNTSLPFSAMDQVYRDDARLQWTASFGFDGGFLYVVSNRWHKAGMLAVDDLKDNILYRVLRAPVNMNSYMGPDRGGPKVDMARGPLQRGASLAARGGAPQSVINTAGTMIAALMCAAFAAGVV